MRITIAQQQSEILKSALVRLKRNQQAKTQASIASQLKVSEPFVSGLVKGHKKIPFRLLSNICEAFQLTPEELAFLTDISSNTSSGTKVFRREYVHLDKHQATVILKDLKHSVILDLLTCKSEEGQPISWTAAKVAQHLGMKKTEVQEKMDFLVQNSLAEKSLNLGETSYRKSFRHMRLPNNSPQLLFKFLHQDMLRHAHQELNAQNVASYNRRMITSATVAIDPKRIPEAKKRIQDFLYELIQLMGNGNPQEVYLMNFNLFPAKPD